MSLYTSFSPFTRTWRCGGWLGAAALVCAFGAVHGYAAEDPNGPNTHIGSQFKTLDLKPVANADPVAKDDPYHLGKESPASPYLWIEAESCKRQSGPEFGIEPRAAASNGQVVGKGFGSKDDQWVEWYFDLPFQTEDGQLYLRAAREGLKGDATLNVSLDGVNVCEFYLGKSGGLGDKDKDFGPTLARAILSHIEMGRHVLRITVPKAGDAINLDGFWITEGEQDFINRVDDQRRLPPPAKLHMLVYPYGPLSLHGIAFELLDPAANNGKGIFLAEPGITGTLPCAGARGRQLQLLGAGPAEAATVEVTAVYADGTSKAQEASFGELFTLEPKKPIARFGRARFGYLATLDLEDKPLREIRFGKSATPYVILAATVETPAPAAAKP